MYVFHSSKYPYIIVDFWIIQKCFWTVADVFVSMMCLAMLLLASSFPLFIHHSQGKETRTSLLFVFWSSQLTKILCKSEYTVNSVRNSTENSLGVNQCLGNYYTLCLREALQEQCVCLLSSKNFSFRGSRGHGIFQGPLPNVSLWFIFNFTGRMHFRGHAWIYTNYISIDSPWATDHEYELF